MAAEAGIPLRSFPDPNAEAESRRHGSLESIEELRRTLTTSIVGGVMEPATLLVDAQEPSATEAAFPRSRKTIFDHSLEKKLSVHTIHWLHSYQGALVQVGICVSFTLLSAYDSVCKSKAVRLSKPPTSVYRPFDFASIVVWVSVASVILGAVVAGLKGELSILWQKESPIMMVKYAPIGILFAFTNYLQFMCLIYLPPDIFGILDQARLLVLGGLSWAVLGKRQSGLAWMALAVISLAAVSYSFVRQGNLSDKKVVALDGLIENLIANPKYNVSMVHSGQPCIAVGPAGSPGGGGGKECKFPFRWDDKIYYSCVGYSTGFWCSVEVDANGESLEWGDCPSSCLQPLRHTLLPEWVLGCREEDPCTDVSPSDVDVARLASLLENKDDPKNLQHVVMKEELTRGLIPLFGGLAQESKDSDAKNDAFTTGISLTIAFMVLQSFASVYQELVLKKYREIPFYIQKVYQETWSIIFCLLNSSVIAPYMASKGLGRKANPEAMFLSNPFYGWESRWVVICFVFLFLRSWLIVMILKMLSSIIKQLCAVCGTALVYFLMIMHSCGHVNNGDAFFCSWDPSDISFAVSASDVGVVLSVMMYMALQSKERELATLQAATAETAQLDIELSSGVKEQEDQPSR